jgi:methionyl-tRNA synthetase
MKIVTAALPYANGPIHAGQALEYITTDIIVRGLNLAGEKAIYCCASDAHGAPIEINAHKQGITPKELVEKYTKEHQEDFKALGIHFDSYYTTDSPENKALSEYLFKKLQGAGLIYEKNLLLQYDEKAQRFLPDRYVKGECPKCSAKDQYGDSCEVCGAYYQSTELKNPYSVITGTTPVQRMSTHYFCKLSSMTDFLRGWLSSGAVQKEVANQVMKWVDEGLEDWCISRDAPYYGFKIPGSDKYFYVWLDAPLGYLSSYAKTLKLTKAEDIFAAWDKIPAIHHIGKDIITFHTLFWPAVLKAAGHRVPEKILVHGHIQINNAKMSKSRGNFYATRDYLNSYPAEALRWYYARTYPSGLTDGALDPAAFLERYNNELVSNLANFCYRATSFLSANYEHTTSAKHDASLDVEIEQIQKEILQAYKDMNVREASRQLLVLGDIANKYFQIQKPWELIKTDKEKTHEVLTTAAALARDIAILAEPILPNFSETIAKQLNVKIDKKELGKPLLKHKIGEPRIILRKLEEARFQTPASVDIRAAKIIKAEPHPQADKLVVLRLDVGHLGERTICAGIKTHYPIEELKDKTIVIVANLEPKALRGITSHGMLLAAEENEKLSVLETDARPGTAVLEGTGEVTYDRFSKLDLKVIDGHPCLNGKPLTAGKDLVRVHGIKNATIR